MDTGTPATASAVERVAAPPAVRRARRAQPEYRLHAAVADLLRVAAKRDIYWTTLPFGEKRPRKTAERLKRLGVRAGAADLLLVIKGRPVFLELKVDGGRQSEAQRATELAFTLAGGLYHVARGYREAFDFLDMIGALRVVTGKHLPRDGGGA